MNRLIRTMLPVLAAVVAAAPAHAEEWKNEVAPYVFGAAMEGRAGVGGVVADVDMSFGDIVDDLELGFMGMYRGSNETVEVTVDTIWMGLGQSMRGPNGALAADVDVDQLALEVAGGYRVDERLTVFGGLRYNDLDLDVRTVGPLGDRRRSGGESWIDPLIGAHYTIPFSDAWSVALRGDVGGFGVGSDFAWQAVATARWQPTPKLGLLAAYRYISMDYDEDGFLYDMTIAGPALGVVFTF